MNSHEQMDWERGDPKGCQACLPSQRDIGDIQHLPFDFLGLLEPLIPACAILSSQC